jgi:hypothetical protein
MDTSFLPRIGLWHRYCVTANQRRERWWGKRLYCKFTLVLCGCGARGPLEEINLIITRFVECIHTTGSDGSVALVVLSLVSDKERKKKRKHCSSLARSDESPSTRHRPVWGTEHRPLATDVSVVQRRAYVVRIVHTFGLEGWVAIY